MKNSAAILFLLGSVYQVQAQTALDALMAMDWFSGSN